MGDENLGGVPKVGDVGASDLSSEIDRLTEMSRTEYETKRKDVARRLGWRVCVLDHEVAKRRPGDDDHDTTGRDDLVESVEPWPDPVDGASLAKEIRDRLRAHVVFGNTSDADAATLWILGSYLMEVWRLWPRLTVTSPTKACGKSTLLEVIESMAHRSILLSNASPAVIFRLIEAAQPTMLLDEADTWAKQDDVLSGILNSGHTRRTANVARVEEVNGKFEAVKFSTWAPLVVAGIGQQRDTLMSRSIVISLRRKLSDESVERLPFDLFERSVHLRQQAARWAADNAFKLEAMEVEPPECGDDRRRDNFTPLLRIAEILGAPWPERLLTAYAVRAEDDDSEPADVMLLRDIGEIFASRGVNRIATSELIAELVMLDDRPWLEWRHGRPLTAQSLGRLLKPFGVRSRAWRVGGYARGYFREDVEAAAARYAPATEIQAATPQPVNDVHGLTRHQSRNREPEVADRKDGNLMEKNEGCGVADSLGGLNRYDPLNDPYHPDAWR